MANEESNGNKSTLKLILKIIIAVATTLAGLFGVSSCIGGWRL